MATCAVVTALVLIQLAAAGALGLTERQPWMDEIHTLELVHDADVGHMMGALADGADFNPPGYFLFARAVTDFAGSKSLLTLRTISLLCVISGLVAIAMMLMRRVRFAVAVAVVAGLWSHTLLIDQSIEARFYAPWFAALAWFCFFVERERHSVFSVVSLCLLAVTVCGVHYFGIISLVLVLAGRICREPKSAARISIWLPAAVGMATIASCYPFYIGQRAALSVPTWISPPDVEHIQSFLNSVAPLTILLIGVLTAIAGGLISRAESPSQSKPAQADWSPLIEMSSPSFLMLFPLVLIVFSYCVQPSLVPRYSLVMLIGCAPLLAWLLHHVRWQMLLSVAGCFLVLGIIRTTGLKQQLSELDRSRDELITLLESRAPNQPVVFENRIDAFPLVWLAGDKAKHWFLMDFADEALKEPSNIRTVQRDVARRFTLWYPRYKLAKIDHLHLRDEFFVVPYPARSTDDIDYGPYQSKQISDRLYRLQRTRTASLFR